MARFVVFLRSINVGGHTVKMDELRRIFESIGFSNVATVIASGNLIFESSSRNQIGFEQKIQVNLKKALGYEVAAFVRSIDEISKVAEYRPFPKMAEGAGLYIAFLPDLPHKTVMTKLLSLQTKTDNFHFHGRELYWLCHTRFSDSPFSGPKLEKILGVETTVRNSNTVMKIAAEYSPSH